MNINPRDFKPIATGGNLMEWIKAGQVMITIDGDAMAPRFMPGQTIGFHVLAPGTLPPIGDDCLIVRRTAAANEAIFRRVADVDTNGVVTLVAINSAKYPDTLITNTAGIVLVAVARWYAQPFSDRRADA